MKPSALVLVALIAGLAAAGWQVWAVPGPDASSARLKIELPGSRKAGQTLLADRIETKNSVIYTTNPGMGRTIKKEDREEKQKEKNSWKMLQHMFIPAHGYNRPPSAQSGAAPLQ